MDLLADASSHVTVNRTQIIRNYFSRTLFFKKSFERHSSPTPTRLELF